MKINRKLSGSELWMKSRADLEVYAYIMHPGQNPGAICIIPTCVRCCMRYVGLATLSTKILTLWVVLSLTLAGWFPRSSCIRQQNCAVVCPRNPNIAAVLYVWPFFSDRASHLN